VAKGVLITFEGGEGAGKTTLIEGIFRYLSSLKIEVIKTREPGGTPFGEKVRTLLLSDFDTPPSPFAELALFLASRAEHVAQVILPALEKGKVVLCDRFHDSSIAYQGIARGLGKLQVEQMTLFLSQGLQSDLTFYLDIDPAIGLHRVSRSRVQDRMEQEGLLFHQKIREAYLTLVKESSGRMIRIDATLPKERVYQEAIAQIAKVVQGV